MPDHHPLHLPSSAEVARTMLAGQGTASLSTPLRDTEGTPVLQAAHPDGTVVLAVPRTGGGPGAVRPGYANRTVAVRIRADAALADLTLPRAHLEVLGWSTPATARSAPKGVRAIARGWPVPGPEIVDRYDVVEVEVAEAELHWVGGCVVLDGAVIRAADPDPLWQTEDDLLERVQDQFNGRLLALVHRLGGLDSATGPHVRLDQTVTVRPIALDRYGLTVRCQDPTDAVHLIRLPFGRVVDDAHRAWEAVRAELTTHTDGPMACAGRPDGVRPDGAGAHQLRASTTGQDPAQPSQP